MAKRPFIWAYNLGSEGASGLGEALGALKIRKENSRFTPNPATKLVINWGDSGGDLAGAYPGLVPLNPPANVRLASNKLEFFRALPADRLVPWTTDKAQVHEWLAGGYKVFARTKLNGHSGEGIVELSDILLDIPDAPVYTRYIPKKSEWRVHVMNGEVIDVQRKIRNPDVPDDKVNWAVRSHDNGFIFARESGKPEDPRISSWAVEAVTTLGLDFGAVDVLWGGRNPYLLEVNTAPGLTGQTLTNYTNAFRRHYDLR